ncbi:Unknown protein, partial [Striga hermonthica]
FSTSASITLSISAPWCLFFCFTGLTVRSMVNRCSITSALMPVNSSVEYANTSAKSLITLISLDFTGSSNSFPIQNFLSSHPLTIYISSTSPPGCISTFSFPFSFLCLSSFDIDPPGRLTSSILG